MKHWNVYLEQTVGDSVNCGAGTYTCGILLREAGHGDLSGRDGGRLQGQAGQWVDDHVGRHRGVGGGHELAAGVGDQAGVHAEGLREQAALLESLLQQGRVDLGEKEPLEMKEEV